jgi:hypothetical protein
MFKTFEAYIENTTQSQRQSHIDLTIDCNFKGKGKKEYSSKRRSQEAARDNLVEKLIEEGILDPSLKGQKFGKNGKVQCNHLCACHSGVSDDKPVCVLPEHCYLGSQSENWSDINPNTNLSARENAIISKNTEESKEKASISQKLSWQERKARLLQTDK